MAISSLTGAGETTAATNLPKTAQEKANLDKDSFLKLLVAQLQNQDPLKPMEGTEFVTQLAQYSLVEQSVNQTGKLDLISTQMNGMASNAAIGLVGKNVTVRGHGVAFDGQTATGASVSLDGPADSVTVTVRDAQGNAVRTMEYGGKAAGTLPVSWDGKDDSGKLQPAGAYTIDVRALKTDGSRVGTTQDVTGTVVGISFAKGYPELELDSGALAPISDLVSVAGEPVAKKTP
jgi:flagellar basal-body rod modification protein FlgD